MEKDLRSLTKSEVKALHGLLRGPLATLSEVRRLMERFKELSPKICKAGLNTPNGQFLKEAYTILVDVQCAISVDQEDQDEDEEEPCDLGSRTNHSPTNHDRAVWALEACKTFGKLTGQNYGEELDDIIGDLMANLLHLANENDIDPMGRVAAALEHFTCEVAEEKEEE